MWGEDFAGFSAEDRERFPVALADLYFKIEGALDTDPGSETGQALAARWMELVESRTGGKTGWTGSMEEYLNWKESWPSDIRKRLTAAPFERIFQFILKAIAA